MMFFTRGIAHISATFFAAIIIVSGTDIILQGPSGLISGLGKSIGGFLIWIIIGVVTMPIGFALRYIIGKLPLDPYHAAVGIGVCIGLALIPVLNPAMMPSLTLASHPISLLIVYSLAGGSGGLIWYFVEFRTANSK